MKVSYLQITLGWRSLPFITTLSAPSLYAENAYPFSEKAEFVRYAERLRESVIQSLQKPEVPNPFHYFLHFQLPLGRQSFSLENKHRHHHFLGRKSRFHKQSRPQPLLLVGIWPGAILSAASTIPIPPNAAVIFPQALSPKLNPFYIALPYNDVSKGGY